MTEALYATENHGLASSFGFSRHFLLDEFSKDVNAIITKSGGSSPEDTQQSGSSQLDTIKLETI